MPTTSPSSRATQTVPRSASSNVKRNPASLKPRRRAMARTSSSDAATTATSFTCAQHCQERVGRAPAMAYSVLIFFRQGRKAAPQRRIEKERVVTESAGPGLGFQDVTANLADRANRFATWLEQGEHADETSGAPIRRYATQLREQRGAPLRPIDLHASVARRLNCGSSVERINFQSAIVGEHGGGHMTLVEGRGERL